MRSDTDALINTVKEIVNGVEKNVAQYVKDVAKLREDLNLKSDNQKKDGTGGTIQIVSAKQEKEMYDRVVSLSKQHDKYSKVVDQAKHTADILPDNVKGELLIKINMIESDLKGYLNTKYREGKKVDNNEELFLSIIHSLEEYHQKIRAEEKKQKSESVGSTSTLQQAFQSKPSALNTPSIPKEDDPRASTVSSNRQKSKIGIGLRQTTTDLSKKVDLPKKSEGLKLGKK